MDKEQFRERYVEAAKNMRDLGTRMEPPVVERLNHLKSVLVAACPVNATMVGDSLIKIDLEQTDDSIETILAAIGILSSSGIKGVDAGKLLNATYVVLSNKQAIPRICKSFGMTTDKRRLSLVDFVDAVNKSDMLPRTRRKVIEPIFLEAANYTRFESVLSLCRDGERLHRLIQTLDNN